VSGSSPESSSESSRVLPPQHRPREDGFTHPADPSRSNLADALALTVPAACKRIQQPHSSYRGVFDALRTIAAKEGVGKLFNGISSPLSTVMLQV
jgi:hypothetical protein